MALAYIPLPPPCDQDHVNAYGGVLCVGSYRGSSGRQSATLCMNATVTFDVSGAIATFDFNTSPPTQTGYESTSAISEDGTLNSITVLHTPTM